MRLFSLKITNRTSHFQNIHPWEGRMHSGFNKDEKVDLGRQRKELESELLWTQEKPFNLV